MSDSLLQSIRSLESAGGQVEIARVTIKNGKSDPCTISTVDYGVYYTQFYNGISYYHITCSGYAGYAYLVTVSICTTAGNNRYKYGAMFYKDGSVSKISVGNTLTLSINYPNGGSVDGTVSIMYIPTEFSPTPAVVKVFTNTCYTPFLNQRLDNAA